MAYVAGGGVADALVQRSELGRPIAALEACLRGMHAADGAKHVADLRLMLQKASICVSVGRITPQGTAATLGSLPAEACAAFVATAERVRSLRQKREMLAAFLSESADEPPSEGGTGAGGLGAAASDAGMGGAGSTGSASGACRPLGAGSPGVDPLEPQHKSLICALRGLGEAATTLLEPHLSGASIARFEALVDFWCTPAHLDAFFTTDAIRSEREELLELFALNANG